MLLSVADSSIILGTEVRPEQRNGIRHWRKALSTFDPQVLDSVQSTLEDMGKLIFIVKK